MNGLIFICILFCGLSGFNEISAGSLSNDLKSASAVYTADDIVNNNRDYGKKQSDIIRTKRGSEISLESVSNASRSASDAVHTAHEIIDIKNEFDEIRKGRKGSGGKRTRRGSEINLESVSNASRSASDAVHTVHEIIDIKKEFDAIKNGKKESGGKRTRRGSEITPGSISDASRSASDAVHTAHEIIDIKNEFNELRKGKKGSGGKRTRRGSEITLESVSNASRSASDAVHTAHEIIDIKKEFDAIKNGKKESGGKRTRRGSEITPGSISEASRSASDAVHTAHEIIVIKNEFNEIRKGKKGSGGKRTRRGSEITLESVSNASRSASDGVHTAHEIIDIKKEFDAIKNGKKESSGKRTRRGSISESVTEDAGSTVNKVTAGMAALLKTYVYQPIAHGNFLESTIRGYTMLETNEGKLVFGTLDGELNQSFRSIMKNRNPRTGDIIACRIPNSRMAEHYMMVINKKIAEVFVVGGKSTNNGVIGVDSYLKSLYINSTECLHHQNRVIARAEQIDEKNGNDKETDLRYQQILERVQCTVNSKTPGKFVYDLMSCNCQDIVLYWAYAYAENKCAESLGCIKQSTLYQIAAYVDESKQLQQPEDYSAGIVIGK